MDLVIREGRPEDWESFLRLLQVVREGMEHKQWLYLDPPEDVRQMLREGTMVLWVAMDDQRLAGAFDMILPGLAQYNYGYDLDLSTEELRSVVNMDTVAVHSDYRGLGLQRTLMREAEREAHRRGYRILLCTVHPDNRFSLNNFLDQGYAIARRLPKYGSERYVLRKDLF